MEQSENTFSTDITHEQSVRSRRWLYVFDNPTEEEIAWLSGVATDRVKWMVIRKLDNGDLYGGVVFPIHKRTNELLTFLNVRRARCKRMHTKVGDLRAFCMADGSDVRIEIGTIPQQGKRLQQNERPVQNQQVDGATADAKEDQPSATAVQEEKPSAAAVQEEKPSAATAKEEQPFVAAVQEEQPSTTAVQEEKPSAAAAKEEQSFAATPSIVLSERHSQIHIDLGGSVTLDNSTTDMAQQGSEGESAVFFTPSKPVAPLDSLWRIFLRTMAEFAARPTPRKRPRSIEETSELTVFPPLPKMIATIDWKRTFRAVPMARIQTVAETTPLPDPATSPFNPERAQGTPDELTLAKLAHFAALASVSEGRVVHVFSGTYDNDHELQRVLEAVRSWESIIVADDRLAALAGWAILRNYRREKVAATTPTAARFEEDVRATLIPWPKVGSHLHGSLQAATMKHAQ